MKELKFIVGTLPKGFKPDFESFVFNGEWHRRLQSANGWQTFNLVRLDKKKIMASVSFCLEGKIASSPRRAPFGSIDFSKSLPARDLCEFLEQIDGELRANGIRTIRIKNPPAAYRPLTASLLEVLLLNLGYRIIDAEINTSITIDEIAYEQKIDSWELRKLNQGKKAKLRFQELPVNLLEDVYGFILSCREEREQSLSMTLAELRKTVEALPQTFVLFGVYHDKELAAASISLRINKWIIYNFYSGHPKNVDSLSPMVSLINGIYGWCHQKRISMIDLGTSAQDSKPNFGLLDFKLRLGGVPSAKFTFEKDLE